MLREYQLTNFKAFGERVTIPIRPLTLIFGANSSGKSSIFQSMLLLKQTLEEAKNPETALLPKGSLVDLGSYKDFVHRHETERDFEFGARFDLEDPEDPLTKQILRSAGATKAGLTVHFSGNEEGRAAALHHLDLAVGEQRQPVISYLAFRRKKLAMLRNRLHDLHSRRKELFNKGKIEEFLRELDKIWEQQEEASTPCELGGREVDFWRHWYNCTKSYIRERIEERRVNDMEAYIDLRVREKEKKELSEDEIVRGYYRIGAKEFFEKLEDYTFEEAIKDLKEALPYTSVDYNTFLPESHEEIESQCLFSFSYFYSPNPETEGMKGLDISPFVLHVCSSFRRVVEELVYLGPLRSQPERYYTFSGDTTKYVGQRGEHLPSILFENTKLVEKVNADLERLDVQYALKVSKLQHEEDVSPSNVFSLRLTDKKTDADASLRDVGFGISQVLPIVAQANLCEKKTLLIEQPEIHLHPAHQAELGDLFIRSAKERGNTLLLETHSEHLLLRIMRRIRQTTTNKLPEGAIPVRPEDVAVLFVESDGSQSIVREMPLNEHGELVKAWPGGFFEEGLREVL